MMTANFRPRVLKRAPTAAALASALMIATAPAAWATYTKRVVVTGENADDVGVQQISFAPTTGVVESIEQEKDDQDGVSVFIIRLSDDATTEGVATIGGKTIRTPASGPGQTLTIDLDGGFAYATGREPARGPAPRGDNWFGGPGNAVIYGGFYAEDFEFGLRADGGTIVTDNGGTFTDEGATIFAPEGRLDGFRVGGGYNFDGLKLSVKFDYVHASREFDYSQTQSVTDANQSAGYAFYGEDATFATGLSVGSGDFATDGFGEVKLDRIAVSFDLLGLAIKGEDHPCQVYPVLGFEHEKLRQDVDIFSTLTSSFGTLTNQQSIRQTNESIGPDIGFGYERNFGAFTLSGGATYQPRWNDVGINADQNVESQIPSFPASIAQMFVYDETHFFHGANATLGFGYTPPFSDQIELRIEGGVRRRAQYSFGQESDGFGRPAGVTKETGWSPNAGLSVRFKF